MDIPQEEVNGCQSLNPEWPSHGSIQFQYVTLRYLPSVPPALHDVTFTIAGGLQVILTYLLGYIFLNLILLNLFR